MKQYDYLIVGAGLFGCTFAWLASQHGLKVLLVDRRMEIGGNLHCSNICGVITHDYGPHIFHTSNEKVYEFIKSHCNPIPYRNCPIARYNNEIYNLPFNMNTFNKMFGSITPSEAQAMIEKERVHFDSPKNLEEQALSLVGRTVYEKLIKGYTEKQWGRPCSELPASIIKRIPIRLTYDNDYFNDKYEFIPEGGYNEFIRSLTKNVDVCTGVTFSGKEIRDIANDGFRVIYTGSLDELYCYSLGRLEYRSLSFVNKFYECSNYQGNAVVNYTDENVKYTRSVEHRHFNPNCKSDYTVITYEYPARYREGKERFYPINCTQNNRLHQLYADMAASEKNLVYGGRLADYRYYNMDQVIEKAFELWEKEKQLLNH